MRALCKDGRSHIPVLAAGGIADARQVGCPGMTDEAAALDLVQHWLSVRRHVGDGPRPSLPYCCIVGRWATGCRLYKAAAARTMHVGFCTPRTQAQGCRQHHVVAPSMSMCVCVRVFRLQLRSCWGRRAWCWARA